MATGTGSWVQLHGLLPVLLATPGPVLAGQDGGSEGQEPPALPHEDGADVGPRGSGISPGPGGSPAAARGRGCSAVGSHRHPQSQCLL